MGLWAKKYIVVMVAGWAKSAVQYTYSSGRAKSAVRFHVLVAVHIYRKLLS
jgi:hypothetical protein